MTTLASHNSQEAFERFRQKVAQNAEAWLDFALAHHHDFVTLDRELDNLMKAIHHANLEPAALPAGLRLVQALWFYVEFRGQWLTWQRTLEKSLDLSQVAGLREDEASLLVQLGELSRVLGRTDTALELQLAAHALFDQLGDPAGSARVLGILSQLHLIVGNAQVAERCCRESAATFESLGNLRELAVTQNNWGIVCMERGDHAGSIDHLREADRLFRKTGKLRGQAKASANLGRVFQLQARREEARSAYGQSVDLYQLIGDELNAARMQVNLATLWYQEGRVAEALAASEQVEQELSRLGDQPWLARVVNNTGVFLQALGRPAEAYVAYHRAAALYAQARERRYACSALVNCVDALLDEGKTVEASAVMGKVDEMLKELDPPPEWLMREVEEQVARLAAVTQQGTR